MAVTEKHREFQYWRSDWRKMRDVLGGQRAIQEACGMGTTSGGAAGGPLSYLPRLSRQTDDEYFAYMRRGSWYDATTKTVDALGGAIFAKDPVVHVDTLLEEQLTNVDLGGASLEVFAKGMVAEVLSVGRYGVLVDVPAAVLDEAGYVDTGRTDPTTQRPYWCGYKAEDILNWWTLRVGGVTKLVKVVLQEAQWIPSPNDEYTVQVVTRYRVLDLVEGLYRQRVYLPGGELGQFVLAAELFPRRGTEPLDFIPFTFVSPVDLCPEVRRPPLAGLADINLAHWRRAVDYAHGLHFTALPTPWIADKAFAQNAEFRIGSTIAWTLSESGTCGMLEFSGQGLGAIKEAMSDDELRMARLGAEMLTPERRQVESAESKRITAASRTASLASLSATASAALTQLAQWHAGWIGQSDQGVADVAITLNQEFLDPRLTPADIQALTQARQAGEISLRTYLENLERGEILWERSVDEEVDEIVAEQDLAAEKARALALEQTRVAAQQMRSNGNAAQKGLQ